MAPLDTRTLPQINPEEIPADINLMVLFGSRAKGTDTHSSDWDVGISVQAHREKPLRLFELDTVVASLLGCSSDALDLVELEHCSYLLQRIVAEEGTLLFERSPGLFLSFCSRAIRQWADWSRREAKLARERDMVCP